MTIFRGDAHKIYRRLKKEPKKIRDIKFLNEIQEIRDFYQSVDSDLLKLIYYRMIKEKSGTGMIPVYVAAVPWLLFLFSSQLEHFLFANGSLKWIFFCCIYLVFLTIGLILHFREKAWADFHIEIIQDILKERK
ncbi:hypothetical protein [Lysinibacillus telephonicus]|uniref:Uncharacterized protein n=1 Tax=Lysinibacillus telephonicus TaxID=1714840 RepID=A0A3S0JRH7_9BACI|nr:hypothetical protein [Lysinibacillus telephonicus]RTQ92744.1 hypothetical protein EKG35_11300 [Lysinibacillus telephonicus]